VCSSSLAVAGSSGGTLPYCASQSLDVASARIHLLVVVIHGDSRNAPDHLRYVVGAAGLAGVDDALVVAPQFLIASDLSGAGLPGSTLYWTDSGWKQGDSSARSPLPRPGSASSFTALDQLIARASSRRTFPNLDRIVIVGHSAGGQLVNRYAATSPIERAATAAGQTVRFVVANPSSYLYFDAVRAHAGAFLPVSAAERQACSKVNAWKYGLERLNGYASTSGAAAIADHYASRSVVYLLGDADTDTSDPSLDTSCAAEWQGRQRLERGRTYVAYLEATYGPTLAAHQVERIVPGVGHAAKAMYQSPVGRRAIFGATP
jgi:pimeloyl-ACP methyl ester carboxylesterase